MPYHRKCTVWYCGLVAVVPNVILCFLLCLCLCDCDFCVCDCVIVILWYCDIAVWLRLCQMWLFVAPNSPLAHHHLMQCYCNVIVIVIKYLFLLLQCDCLLPPNQTIQSVHQFSDKISRFQFWIASDMDMDNGQWTMDMAHQCRCDALVDHPSLACMPTYTIIGCIVGADKTSNYYNIGGKWKTI